MPTTDTTAPAPFELDAEYAHTVIGRRVLVPLGDRIPLILTAAQFLPEAREIRLEFEIPATLVVAPAPESLVIPWRLAPDDTILVEHEAAA